MLCSVIMVAFINILLECVSLVSWEVFSFSDRYSLRQGLILENSRSISISIERPHRPGIKQLTLLFAWNVRHGWAIQLWKLLRGSPPSWIPCSWSKQQKHRWNIDSVPLAMPTAFPGLWQPGHNLSVWFECWPWPCTSCLSPRLGTLLISVVSYWWECVLREL